MRTVHPKFPCSRRDRLGSAGWLGLFILGVLALLFFGWRIVDRAPEGDSLQPVSNPEEEVGLSTAGPELESMAEQAAEVSSQVRTQGVDDAPVTDPSTAPDWGDRELVAWKGQVLSSKNALPLPGAVVVAEFSEGEVEATTDDLGNFVLRAPSGLTCTLKATCDGYAERAKAEVPVGPEVHMLLLAMGTIEGIYEPGGSGLSAQLFQPGTERWDPPLLSVPVGEEGEFRFEDLTPGRYSVAIVPGVYGVRKDLLVPPGEGVALRIEGLGETASVRGRVLYEGTEVPVPGASVLVRYHALGVPGLYERDARVTLRSDKDGRFVLPIARSMRTAVHIEDEFGTSRETGYADIEFWKKQAERVWYLGAPGELAGRVVDADGEGVPGVLVRLDRGHIHKERDQLRLFSSAPWSRNLRRSVRTDGEGAFDFGKVPSKQQLTLVAEPLGYSEDYEMQAGIGGIQVVRIPPGAKRDNVEIRMALPGELVGSISDTDGLPWEGLRVVLHDLMQREIASARTDGDGRFSLSGFPVRERWGLRLHIFEGQELLANRQVQFPEVPKGVVAPAPEVLVHEVEYVLARKLLTYGFVRDGEGYGVPQVRVVFSEPSRGLGSCVTDVSGKFAMRDRRNYSGPVKVQCRRPGWKIVGKRALSLQTPLPRPLVIVMEPDRADAPARVQGEMLAGNTGEPVPRLRFQNLAGGMLTTQSTRFSINGIRAGRFRPRVRTPGFEYIDLPAVDLAPGARMDLGSFRLDPACDTTLIVRGLPNKRWPKGAQARLNYRSGAGERPDWKPKRYTLSPRGVISKDLRLQHQGVPRGRWELVLKVPGYQTVRRVLNLNRRRSTTTVTLKPARGAGKGGR